MGENNETIASDFEKAEEEVKKVEEFCTALGAFDASLKTINDWMAVATNELEDIKAAAGAMLPEDRVARTMDLQEDIAAKVEILATNAATEKELLPQGDKVPSDAQDYKDKPNNLDEVKALHEKVSSFDKTCVNYLKVLEAAEGAAKKMTTTRRLTKRLLPSRRGTPRSRPSPTNGFQGRHPLQGVGPPRQHCHRAQHLGRQGQDPGGREPVLPREDGVHPRRTQEHLQAEGEACRDFVNPTWKNG